MNEKNIIGIALLGLNALALNAQEVEPDKNKGNNIQS